MFPTGAQRAEFAQIFGQVRLFILIVFDYTYVSYFNYVSTEPHLTRIDESGGGHALCTDFQFSFVALCVSRQS